MTVRWKPLLILSGLFLMVAVVGVIAMAWTLVPKTAGGVLKQARAEAAQGRFDHAEIHFQQALQLEGKNAAIHEELANLYRDWAGTAPAEKREKLQAERISHLMSAVKFDRGARGPRLQLLETAIAQDQSADSVYWAREILKVDSDNTDAHTILAIEELDSPSPNIPEAKRHLKVLEDRKAAPIRPVLIKARLAQLTGDGSGRDEAFAQARGIVLPAEAGAVDLMARVRLEAMEIQARKDGEALDGLVKSLIDHVRSIVASPDLSAGRVTKLSQLLEQTQRSLVLRAGRPRASGETSGDPLADLIEVELEGIFKKVLSSQQKPDLQVYFAYADHLRFRQQRDRCLQVVDEALRMPAAALPASLIPVMGMHTVAIEMALAKQDDASRYQKADPHIQALLASSEPRFQGLGNLFQGAVELEQSGLARAVSRDGEKNEPVEAPQPKLRAQALNHLKQAAAQLPYLPEAQARYGVALVLNQEQSLGRQYLQNALRMGNLDPQYQFWAAWTILQAGYPEEAAPVVEALFGQLAQGTIPPEMKGTLHQLSGELYQARRGPGDMERAAREFDKAAAVGQAKGQAKGQGVDSIVVLRQAQIDVQLGHHDQALARIDQIRKRGAGGAAAENLAVLILEEQGKTEDARGLLRDARKRFPGSADLAGLDAALNTKDGKPEDANRVLKEHLAQDPDNVSLTLMRAQILAESLKRPKEARELLLALTERSENSSPLVQLAQFDMEQNDLSAAAATIAKIRSRWKDSATGDILDGQLALKRGSIPTAREHFAEALKKDPDNKIVQFWKAQLDSRAGSVTEAARALESLVKDRPTKEVDAGVSLLTAAQSSLANLELQTGKLDDAIRRFEELKRNSETGTLNRSDRWQLITAYVARNQWPVARRELAAILNDAKSPPSADERVRGAILYRQQKEDAPALAQLDYVLKTNPTNASAVVTRAYIHLGAHQNEQAAGLLRRAIDQISKKPEKPAAVFYLMLAAVENETPPAATAPRRAQAVLEQGLQVQPESLELVQAEYLLLGSTGDPKAAMALIEAKAKNDPKGIFRRFLVDVLREQRNYEKAEQILSQLVKDSPEDVNLAAALVQVVSLEAADASALGQTDRQRTLDEKAQTMIREDRKRYPSSPVFLQAECDLAARTGDFARAVAITEEIDKLSPSSSMGPMLRARLFARQNKPNEVIKAYTEALERNPSQPDIRVLLGQELIRLGRADEALTQARAVLGTSKDRLDAILLEARALAAATGTEAQKEAARQSAVARLEAAITAEPRSREAYHLLADIQESRGRRSDAIAALQRGFKANPQDSLTLARLVQTLSGPGPGGQSPRAEDIAESRRLASEILERDKEGSLALAAGVGFHKAGQFELSLPLARKAAAQLDSPEAHLNLGDLILSMAESQTSEEKSRPLFEQAVQEYDRVLKIQPGQVEAVNNKAWILHTYLGRSEQALALAQDLMKHANPASLPGEFYDTLGAIQEALGRQSDAEQSYQSGLSRSPEHPVLNYHFGRLLAADGNRSSRARGYLAKALAARDQLSPAMARDVEGLVKRLSPPISGN